MGEFSMSKVVQAFDENKFNFKKAKQDEVLFQFEMSVDDFTSCYEEKKIVESNASFVYINISPIEYGHVLLVPKVLKCIPQQMSTECLLTALHMSVEVHNPCFKFGFNTLGAYASINHLHFQGYFLNAPFPVERVETEYLQSFGSKGDKELRVSKLLDYPVRAMVLARRGPQGARHGSQPRLQRSGGEEHSLQPPHRRLRSQSFSLPSKI